jgi:thiol-disulfide isomerase/thioredoxin
MRTSLIAPLVIAGLALTSLAHADAKLKIGDKAPALQVAKWIKGQPVKSFEKGKTYVVEFWATWCGPCRESIPHLSELAKKYKGKVTFTGVSVFERNEDSKKPTAYMDNVAKFVKDMGEKMEYNVAVDDVKGTIGKTLMEAAEQEGIPTAFIVDKDARIAWIGHPMSDLDATLGQVVEGKFDSKAYAAKQEKAQQGQSKEALTELNKVLADNPQYEKELAFFKYTLLLKVDEATAYPLATKLATGDFKDNPQALNALARSILDEKSGLKSPDYDVALKIAERASEVTKNEHPIVLAHFKKGNVDKAIETEEKALAQLDKMKDVPEAAKENLKKQLTTQLETYKKKKSGS